MNVADQIGRAARRFPDALAVISGDFRLTFKELDERSDRLAHALMGLGLSKGDRVATFLENSHHCVEVDFALSKAGLIRVSLNPRSTADDLEYVLRNCESGVLIYGGSFDATVAKAAPSAAQVQHWIRVEEPGDAPRDAVSTGNYETLIAGAAADLNSAAATGNAMAASSNVCGAIARPGPASSRSRASTTSASRCSSVSSAVATTRYDWPPTRSSTGARFMASTVAPAATNGNARRTPVPTFHVNRRLSERCAAARRPRHPSRFPRCRERHVVRFLPARPSRP